MKYNGSDFRFKQERNNDLVRAFHELIRSAERVCILDIYKQVVNMPSARFWVSEERAAVVIGAMMRGDKLAYMRNTKREMFEEIYRRAMIIARRNPEMTSLEIATIVVRQPAPKFYLTPESAAKYIKEAKKQWYEQRKKKLKHLFY